MRLLWINPMNLSEVFERFNMLINDLKFHDKYYEIEEVHMKFLITLPDHLKHRISTIREGKNMTEISLKSLYGVSSNRL